MHGKNYLIVFFGCLSLIMSSCRTNKDKNVEISQEVKIIRFDSEFQKLNLESLMESSDSLRKKHPLFYDLYVQKIIQLGNPEDPRHYTVMKGFLTDFAINTLTNEANKVFNDTKKVEHELNKAFNIYKQEFPKAYVPKIYTFIGGLNQSIVTADSILGVGIDKYLGADWKDYNRFGIPVYLQRQMDPGRIPVDALKGWIMSEYGFKGEAENVINHIVYNGIIQYALDVIFPEADDTLRFGFSAEQMNWCRNNEKKMWTYLVENKMIFNNEQLTIRKLVGPAPFTAYFTKESPGGAVIYIGREIVRKYMGKHSEMKLDDLFKIKDYNQILTESKYKP